MLLVFCLKMHLWSQVMNDWGVPGLGRDEVRDDLRWGPGFLCDLGSNNITAIGGLTAACYAAPFLLCHADFSEGRGLFFRELVYSHTPVLSSNLGSTWNVKCIQSPPVSLWPLIRGAAASTSIQSGGFSVSSSSIWQIQSLLFSKTMLGVRPVCVPPCWCLAFAQFRRPRHCSCSRSEARRSTTFNYLS